MTELDNRQKAFENKFAHDEEMKFKIAARRRKLLGLWAAEAMKLGEEDGLKYALSLVQYGIDDQTPGAVVNKVIADIKAKGTDIAEAEIRKKNYEFEETAIKQISPR